MLAEMATDLARVPERLLANAAANANRKPSIAQKTAGNYRMGHVRLHGLDVTIENPKGSIRSGTSKDGHKWSVVLPDHYGYLKRTEGADGEHVDVYIGPNPASHEVFIVDQIDLRTRRFDEHKVMLGYANRTQALNAYHRAFSDGKAGFRIGHVERMTIDEFKRWLHAGDTSKPIGKQMPLLPGKKNIGRNIEEMEAAGHKRSQSIAAALRTAGAPKRANGGQAGPLRGATPGRADAVPSTVEDGSHILSADCVSALGDGNTEAGYAKLMKLFPHSVPRRAAGGGLSMPMAPHETAVPGTPHMSLPRLTGLQRPHITAAPHLAGVPRAGGAGLMPHLTKPRLAKGGSAAQVDVNLSHGEFCVVPRDVRDVAGKGDIEHGHRVLDEFQMQVRKGQIAKLSRLPGPVKT